MNRRTYEEWRDAVKRGALGCIVDSPSWLLEGCPTCGCKEWQVTNDHWCYCDKCARGFPTDFAFTNRSLAHFDENGYHCFMCKGTGETRAGNKCDECNEEYRFYAPHGTSDDEL